MYLKNEWGKVNKHFYIICNIVYERDPNTDKVLLKLHGDNPRGKRTGDL